MLQEEKAATREAHCCLLLISADTGHYLGQGSRQQGVGIHAKGLISSMLFCAACLVVEEFV